MLVFYGYIIAEYNVFGRKGAEDGQHFLRVEKWDQHEVQTFRRKLWPMARIDIVDHNGASTRLPKVTTGDKWCFGLPALESQQPHETPGIQMIH